MELATFAHMEQTATSGLLNDIEWPGGLVTQEQISMAALRYTVARDKIDRGTVLEVGCGPGVGFRILLAKGLAVVGGDIRMEALAAARSRYGSAVSLVQLDADRLPFPSGQLSGVLLYEMLYYCPDPPAVLAEARRVLAQQGRVIICSPNPTAPSFRPSKIGMRYFDVSELEAMLATAGFRAEMYGAFEIGGPRAVHAAAAALRRGFASIMNASRPGVLAKRVLQNVLLGRRLKLPAEVSVDQLGAAGITRLGTDPETHTSYRVLFAVGVAS